MDNFKIKNTDIIKFQVWYDISDTEFIVNYFNTISEALDYAYSIKTNTEINIEFSAFGPDRGGQLCGRLYKINPDSREKEIIPNGYLERLRELGRVE